MMNRISDTGRGRTPVRRVLGALVAGLLLSATGAAAAASSNDMPKASKYTNVTWYEVVHVNFKAGKTKDALKIVRKYFIPAAKKAGVPGPVMVLVNRTGPWDLTILWKLKDGPSQMEWKITPQDEEWFKALAELNGGAAKAREIRSHYVSYIQNGSATLSMSDPSLAGP